MAPAKAGTATAVMTAEAESNFLHENVLPLDWTQMDAETVPCMQPEVALAWLTWDDYLAALLHARSTKHNGPSPSKEIAHCARG